MRARAAGAVRGASINPMDLQERDASYHRRLGLIGSVVVASLLVVVIAGQRWAHRNDPIFAGWKGEMELLPELTIEPDVVTPQAAPEPLPREHKDNASLTVAQESEFETAPPVESKSPLITEPDMVDVNARGAALSEALPSSRPVSYSETFVILRTVKPKYPPHERDRGIEGSVTVELLVTEEGLVAHADALELVGPVSFQDSALEAVRQFEFMPPKIDGVASTMWIRFVIKFRMNN